MQTGTATSHDDLAANYDRQRSSVPFELDEILREHGLIAGRRVLDIGIGTGLASEPLASAGVRITGIDPSAETHRAAAARELGVETIPDASSRGFRSFHAAPFTARALRIVPTVIRATAQGWMSAEFTRAEVRSTHGSRAHAYGAREAPLTVRVLSYLYLGTV
jgi:SAM-dependent methyltransferase